MVIRILIPRPQRKGRRLRPGKFVWVALGIAVWGIAYTLFGAGGMIGVYRAETETARLEERVQEAEATNRDLRARIRAVRDDPREIERIGREELFLVHPDDRVFLLPPDDRNPAADGEPETGSVPPPLEGTGDRGDSDPPEHP